MKQLLRATVSCAFLMWCGIAVAKDGISIPSVTKADFKVKLTGVAVSKGDSKDAIYGDVDFVDPSAELDIPFGRFALFRVQCEIPMGYRACVEVMGIWPAGVKNSAYFGHNPHVCDGGDFRGFLFLIDRDDRPAPSCELRKVAVRICATAPKIGDGKGWIVEEFPVALNFKAKDGSGANVQKAGGKIEVGKPAAGAKSKATSNMRRK